MSFLKGVMRCERREGAVVGFWNRRKSTLGQAEGQDTRKETEKGIQGDWRKERGACSLGGKGEGDVGKRYGFHWLKFRTCRI